MVILYEATYYFCFFFIKIYLLFIIIIISIIKKTMVYNIKKYTYYILAIIKKGCRFLM